MTVVHCKKAPYDVYIGRPSKWGNPFVIGKDGTREQVIAKYRQYLLSRPDLIAALPELKGKILGCWCSPQAGSPSRKECPHDSETPSQRESVARASRDATLLESNYSGHQPKELLMRPDLPK